MKPSLLILLFTLLLPMPASAQLYKWIDDNGVFHVVDNLHKVPQKDRYRLGLDLEALKKEIQAPEKSIIKPAPKPQVSPIKAIEQKKPIDPSAEIFGGKTLKWWVQTLTRVKREISEIERSISSKEEYVSVFNNGRRLGTTYDQKSVDRYNRYNEELIGDIEKLAKKKEYLEKLLRRAKNAGIPKNLR